MSPYRVYICGDTGRLEMPEPKDCPNAAFHTPQPEGYVEWHNWAQQMTKGFKQKRCPGCGLLNIWEPRATR